MKNLLFLFLTISGVSASLAQEDSLQISSLEVSMITNRPGATEASRAVYKGGFQIEMGLEYGEIPLLKGSADHSEYLLLPNIGFLYGVSENVELRLFTTNYATRSAVNGGLTQFVYNVSQVIAGAKINVSDAKGLIPEMAVLISQGFPTNPSDVRKQWPTEARLAWSYSLPANFGLSGNLGYINNKESFEQHITFSHSLIYTLNLGYAINENVGLFAEAFGEDDVDNNDQFPVNIDGGVWYRFNNKLQVDASVGYGSEFSSHFYNVGFSWLVMK